MKARLSASYPHPEDLETGRVLAPGENVTLSDEELQTEKARALVESGDLFLLEEPGEPFEGYDKLGAEDVVKRLAELEPNEIEAAKAYEATHKNRKTIIEFDKEDS